jgi:hypothetical protein
MRPDALKKLACLCSGRLGGVALEKADFTVVHSCPLSSMVLGHVDDNGEFERSNIPHERLSMATYPYQRGIFQLCLVEKKDV